MSRITTARGAVVIAAVAASALALSACYGLGRRRLSKRRRRRHIEAHHRHRIRYGRARLRPVRYGSGQRMFFEGIYDSLFVLDQEGQIVPQLVTKFEYSEDKTQLTLDLDTSATFERRQRPSPRTSSRQNLDARGDPDLSAYNGVRRGRPERDHRRRPSSTRTPSPSTFAQPQPGFEANLVMPGGRDRGRDGRRRPRDRWIPRRTAPARSPSTPTPR